MSCGRILWQVLAVASMSAAIHPELMAQGDSSLPSNGSACDSPDAAPWVRELRDRVVSGDRLAGHAVNRFGSPVSCVGAVTSEFDGTPFGVIRLSFREGVSFQLETMPPETSIVTLNGPPGFEDEATLRALAESYSNDLGLRIDWLSPTVTTEDGYETRSFWDPEPGLNGSASLVLVDGIPIALRVSLAL